MKPSFKRKFSVPSQSVKPTRDDQNEASPVNKNTENDLNKEVTEEPKVTCKVEYSPVENVETYTQNTNEPKQALSDSQYDEIFDAVLTKATSDNLNLEKSKSEKAADQFVKRMQNSTPTNIQEQNEITPSTSPQEDTRSPPKLLLKKCSKDKSEKSDLDFIKAPHKRTSLGYSKPDKERHSLGNLKTKKKENHRRHQTCDESSRKNSEKVFNKGVWVQCGERDCLKWRFLPDCSDPSSLPGFWRCSLNNDDDQNKCSAPEVDWTSCLSSSQDHFVYTEYNAGSIVWAKMAGYPPWPAMVDSDPDTDMLYEYDEEGTVLRYHVVFLDKNVSRAWIPSRCIEPYNHSNNQLNLCNEKHFKSELNTAITAADEALTMSLAKRIEKFSFGQRFKGDKESIWTSLTKTRKSKKRKNKFLMEQVVPVSPSPSAESKNSNDYWETATDDMLPLSKKEENHGKKKKREKVEKEKKEKKKKNKDKAVDGSKESAKTKTAFKPTFVAPAQKTALDVSKETEIESQDVPLDGAIKFDPDIYTMELNSKKTETNKQNDPAGKSPKDPQINPCPGSPDLIECSPASMGSQDEPINLSLKDEQVLPSPVLPSEKQTTESFWSAPLEKNNDLDDDNVFSDLEMDDVKGMNWDDKEIDNLDDLMPDIIAITDTTRGGTSRATEFFDELPKELQCPKCGDLFDRPVLLSCSHTLCMDCAEDAIEYAELELKQRRRFSCPICRSAIKYNATGIESLPRNINIEEAVARFKKEGKSHYPVCDQHAAFKMEMLMWCEECKVNICPLCAVGDEHKQHKITPMQVVEKFQRIKRRLKNTKDALNEEIDVLGESIVKQQKIVYDLNEKAKDLRLKVDQECDEMIAQIEKRRKSMYADVDKALNGKREKPDKKIETLRSQFTKMQVLTIQIQEVLEVKDAKDFIETFNINGLPGKLQDMGKYIQS